MCIKNGLYFGEREEKRYRFWFKEVGGLVDKRRGKRYVVVIQYGDIRESRVKVQRDIGGGSYKEGGIQFERRFLGGGDF